MLRYVKLVREYINEKFTADSDPIKDLDIGIYAQRNFKNYEEIAAFIVRILPTIIGTTEIPKNVIASSVHYINDSILEKVNKYLCDYISLNGKHIIMTPDRAMTGYTHQAMNKILRSMGYKNK